MVVSRHRSPKGRRAHHGPPLSALVAAAGSGGAHRSIPLPSVFPTPMHAVAAVVVGLLVSLVDPARRPQAG